MEYGKVFKMVYELSQNTLFDVQMFKETSGT